MNFSNPQMWGSINLSPYLRINPNAYLIRMRIWRLRNIRAANSAANRKALDDYMCALIRRHWSHRHDAELFQPSRNAA